MADNKLTQNLKHSIVLTSEMRKNLDILQANTLNLQNIIRHNIESNPMLEEVQPDSEIDSEKESEEDFDNDFSAFTLSKNSKHDFLINSIPEKSSLREDLITQAYCDYKDEDMLKTFARLCEYLDERGFLEEDSILAMIDEGFDKDKVEESLEILRSLEPAGVGAKDLRDCFLLQLERTQNILAYRIIDECYDLFLKRKIVEIAKKLCASKIAVEHAFEILAKLHTSPAREYENLGEDFIFADIAIVSENNELRVELLDKFMPELRINNDYRTMLASGKFAESDGNYLREKIGDAKFLIKAIKARNDTLLAIANYVANFQRDYFFGGNLKNLTMTKVAEELNFHLSTISRAVSEKYVYTNSGIKPLKFFFANAFESESGEELSTDAVKKEILKFVAEEDASAPLSDSQIAELLKEKNMEISRRTVAKYRDELGIASKSMRKRHT